MSDSLKSDVAEIPRLNISKISDPRSPEKSECVLSRKVEEQGNNLMAEDRVEVASRLEDTVSDSPSNQVKEEEGDEESESGIASSASRNLEVHTSLLSEFDDFVANEKHGVLTGASRALSYGFEIGDMVWGKVKSHPWWPGQIFDENLASSSVRRTRREGHVLVAFFGDSSYGWFDPAELIPFDDNFEEKAQQSNAKSFVKAVEESVDEASRRSALGLLCICNNPLNFKSITVDGYFSVDVPEFEPNGIYSTKQIMKSREDFSPSLHLARIKLLAAMANDINVNSVEIVKCKAEAVAFRKAVFEGFDEPYSQAFGTPSSKISAYPTDHRAPLSGPLVIAETLGCSSKKSIKIKESNKKDKYVLKKRDDSADEDINQQQQADTLNQIVYSYPVEDYVLQKRVQESRLPKDDDDTVLETGMSDITVVIEPSSNQPDIVEETEQGDANTANVEQDDHTSSEGTEVKKVKRTAVESGVENAVSGEKKAKKAPDTTLDSGNEEFDVCKLLKELRLVAFESSNGEPRRMSPLALQFFLRFRSSVYQKSLSFSTQNELGTTDSSKNPSVQLGKVKKAVRLKDAEPAKQDTTSEHDQKLVQPDRQEEIPAKRIKKTHTEVKKLVAKADALRSEDKETKTAENPTKSSEPAMLVMRFPPQTSLPSGAELKAKFARFGAIDVSQIRVFWKSSTCRVVFRHRRDAESAWRYAVGNPSIFGKMEVRYSLRDVGEGPDTGRIGRGNGSNENAKLQPKSILKKSSGEEGGHVAGGKGSRVKFVLGEETSDLNKNNLVKGPLPPSHLPPLLPLPKFGKGEINNPRSSQNPISQNVTDVSQQMLSLLLKCNDLVSTLTNVYGVVPYRPL